jgi:hypothetical protein
VAAKWQARANSLYPDPQSKAKGKELLDLYRQKKPYREMKS